jgi:hypothetical protein
MKVISLVKGLQRYSLVSHDSKLVLLLLELARRFKHKIKLRSSGSVDTLIRFNNKHDPQ